MPTTTIQRLVDHLHQAGLKLSLAGAGGLAVAPSSSLTPDLRGMIRDNKPSLIEWVTADNETRLNPVGQLLEYRLYSKLIAPPAEPPVTHQTEPSTDIQDWHELDAAYLNHHVSCKTCIAAGRGTRYGLRCGTGAALWTAYEDSTEVTPKFTKVHKEFTKSTTSPQQGHKQGHKQGHQQVSTGRQQNAPRKDTPT